MPFSLSLKLRKKAKVSVELSLRAKLNREKASNEVGTHTQAGSTETLLEEVKSEEAEVFEYEYLLTLQRFDEQSLRSDLAEAKRALSSFGVFEVEWVGLSPALIATLPGRDIHVNQSEKSEILLPLLPIHVTGESFTIPQSVPHSLPLHRLDGSVHHFDLFNRKFSASNCLITGRTGGGKSVFGNLLSRSLLTSPQIEMIKVDVGGSYSRECKLYQGLEIEFQLSKPSGLDPFALLSENVTHDELSVLSEFLSTLSLEEGESVLPKKERSVIEDALTAYIAGSKKPSFQEFLIKSKDLTRREILKRFGKGGIYENAISNANSRSIVDIRYLYYNFSNLVGATNQDYASCVMASVIAAVNLKMLRISKEKETGQIRRLVFFCDETKFFLHKNRKFFQLTVANFRKYGHSVILVSQSLDDFRFEDRNSTDDSLLLNCPVRVYFPSLASESTLKEVCGLTSEDSEWIRSNEMRAQSGARTLLLQDDLGVRRIQVILTKSEYWSTTSTLQDVALLQDLKSKLPWLTETQAIEIMTLSQSEMVS
jgi:type IV secretory pathway VirB4 component